MRGPSVNIIDLVPRARSYHEAKYRASLGEIPVPGHGRGCHRKLLGVATLGVRAGHTTDEILIDIKNAIPAGARKVSDQEIMDAIVRAFLDTAPAGSNSSALSDVKVDRRRKLSEAEAEKVREHVLSYRNGPVKLDSEDFKRTHGFQLEPQPLASLYPEAFSMIQLLKELYELDDPLWIGSKYSTGVCNIRSAGEWINFFEEQQAAFLERLGNEGWNSPEPSAFIRALGMSYSHIIPNIMTGRFGKTKTNGPSLRCDDCVCGYRFAILDFDDLSLDEQGVRIHCLSEALGISFGALIHTGGRGYHGWVRIHDVNSSEEWDKKVRDELFPKFEALGADPTCFNPSRASRLPGIYRCDTASWQKLIITNKNGVKV